MNSLTKETIKTSLNPVFRFYNIRRATLFGSYAKGTANEKSDVDLYVDSGLKGMRFVGFMESVRKALNGKDVDIFDATHVERGSKVKSEIEETGELIYER